MKYFLGLRLDSKFDMILLREFIYSKRPVMKGVVVFQYELTDEPEDISSLEEKKSDE